MNQRHGIDNQAVKARRRMLENLTLGTVYAIQMRAVGDSTGYSYWSDAVFRMAM